MVNVIRTRKLSFNRNNKRLWLTPKLVAEAGLAGDDVFYQEYSNSENGPVLNIHRKSVPGAIKSKVANTAKGGVIDINRSDLTKHFQDYEEVNISLVGDTIIVSGAIHESKIVQRESAIKRRAATNEPIRKGGIFVGTGLLCHSVHKGLHLSGVKTKERFGAELEELPSEVNINTNEIWDDCHKDALFYQGDIHHLDSKLVPKLDMLVIGFPCPASSKLNTIRKTTGQKDVFHPQTGTVFQPTLTIIIESNPALVVLENVVGFRGSIVDHIMCDVMRRQGYLMTETYVTGTAHGDFEMRKRLCRVWYSKNLSKPNLDEIKAFEQPNQLTVEDILEPISLDDTRWGRRSYLEAKTKESKNNHQYRVVSNTDSVFNTIGANYGRIQPDSPMIAHPNKQFFTRIFTQSEHCNIRGISGQMKKAVVDLAEGKSDLIESTRTKGFEVHKMLGNSCTPKAWVSAGRMLGNWIKSLGGAKKTTPPAKVKFEQMSLISE